VFSEGRSKGVVDDNVSLFLDYEEIKGERGRCASA
jgi:hypothetical protein